MEILVPVIIVGCITYDIGSVSAAWFAAKARGIDLRVYGSGQLDFANAWMVLGDRVGALVFIADFLKAQLALGFAWYMSDSPWIVALAFVCVVLGEILPVFHGFWGGRGTATTCGALLGVSPLSLAICATIALLIAVVTGRRDHAELIAILLLPAVIIFVSKGDIPLMCATVIIAAMLLLKRRKLVDELLGIGKDEN